MGNFYAVKITGLTTGERKNKAEGEIVSDWITCIGKADKMGVNAVKITGIATGERKNKAEGEVVSDWIVCVGEADEMRVEEALTIMNGSRYSMHQGEMITSPVVEVNVMEINGPRKWPLEISWKCAMVEG